MSKLSIVTTSAIALLAGTTSSSRAIAQQGSLRQQLVGAWSLISCDYKAPFCSNGTGSISFGGSGRYTEVILGGDRPKITLGAQDRATTITPDQYKAIGQGTVAQFGTWSINEAEKTLTMHAEKTFFGGGDGRDFKLSVSLNGDELKVVSSSGNLDSRDLGSTSTWKKAPNPPQTLRQQLIGTWNLVSCDDMNRPVCANPSGGFSISANGHYTAFYALKGRPKVASLTPGNRANVTPEDYKTAAQGVVAGLGTWNLNEADRAITFRIDGGLFPNAEGTEAKGTIVSLEGDDLKTKGTLLGNATWRRAK